MSALIPTLELTRPIEDTCICPRIGNPHGINLPTLRASRHQDDCPFFEDYSVGELIREHEAEREPEPNVW